VCRVALGLWGLTGRIIYLLGFDGREPIGRCKALRAAPCWVNGIGKTWRRGAYLTRYPRACTSRSVPCRGRAAVFVRWATGVSHGDRTLINPARPQSPYRPLRLELTSDEGFDHVNRSVRLRARLNNPAVLGTREDFVVNLAARRPIRRDEVLLYGGEHVII
jgi:hypothetical protein